VDWTVRDFHSYQTDRGATYNAYLVRDEKTALIDTVKAPFAEDLLRNISALTDPESIDYVVCNHDEPDHSGALPRVLEAMPDATLVCDEKCRKVLALHYDVSGWRFEVVASGDTIALGKRTLQFLVMPMICFVNSENVYFIVFSIF